MSDIEKNSKIRLVKVICRFGEPIQLTSDISKLDFKNQIKKQVFILHGCKNAELQTLVNLYLMRKTSNNKDTSSISRAMYQWLLWLESKNISAFVPSVLHYKSPTYGFKESLLARINDEKNISNTTANSYMNAVKNFYVFLNQNSILAHDGFFKYELAQSDRGTVQSTDLRIKVATKHGSTLNPLNQMVSERLLETIQLMSERDSLLISLLLGCGLRGQEARTMNALLFDESRFIESESFLIRGVMIGDKTGVNTKFSIERELFITKPMYEQVLDFIDSKVYKSSLSKYMDINGDDLNYKPLFLTSGGKSLTTQNYYNIWNKFKMLYKNIYGVSFNHKPHDLRATFGTCLLSSILIECNDIMSCLSVVKEALGHRDESQTLKYVKYLSHTDMLNKTASILDEHAVRVFVGA